MPPKPASIYRNYQAGETIFKDGDPGDCAYLIERGQVSIHKHVQGEDVVMATFGKGEIFGEMAILDGLNRSAAARAIEDCQLMVIQREQLFDQLQKTPITHLLVKILLKRIRNTTDKLARVSGTAMTSSAPVFDSVIEAADQPAIDRIRLGSELQHALAHEEFRLHYQPIVDIQSRKVLGFEALIRWQSQNRGLVPPNVFIDLLEESSLIVPVGSWIQERAFTDLNRLKAHFGTELFMSLNISVRQLENSFFVEELNRHTAAHGLGPAEVKLEVTERILMDGQSGLALLADAKQKGYLISIDDFGTGYSNFQFLTKFGFDSLKVDRSLLRAAMLDPQMAVVLRGITGIAHGLSIDLIAEGIETEEELGLVRGLNVGMGQGYLFAKPLPFDELIKVYPKGGG